MMREQNQRIADMLDSAGIRQAFAGIEFNLPEGWAEQVAAYHDQVASEVAAEEEAEPASGLRRLAEEREAISLALNGLRTSLGDSPTCRTHRFRPLSTISSLR